jgi:hypothetical protein
MGITASPLSPIEIVLEIRIRLGDLDEMVKGGGMKRRSPQIGMDDHSGRIDDATKARPGPALDFFLEEGEEAVEREEGFVRLRNPFRMEESFTELFQRTPDGLNDDLSRIGS